MWQERLYQKLSEPVSVDYAIDLSKFLLSDVKISSDQIKQSQLDWQRHESCVDVPKEGLGTVQFGFLHYYGGRVPSVDVYETLNQTRRRPAVVAELLAFKKYFPDAERDFHVVALGEYFHLLYPHVLVLESEQRGNGSLRAQVDPRNMAWLPEYHFLVVKQSS